MKLKHQGMLFSETLPKHEGMKDRFKAKPKLTQEMRNYSWEWFCDYSHSRAYYKKYRRHGQYNGKKPRKREKIRKAKQFREKYKEALLAQFEMDILNEPI